MFVEMKVRGLALDQVSNMPIIILRDEEDKRSLQIWVGIFEANAIALELEKVAPARPMTHDLIKNILETLEARVLKVVVTDLKENTFFAVLHLQLGGTEYTVDSRPSDAIALALRVAAPIYVDEEVIRKAKSLDVTKEAEPAKAGRPGSAARVAAEHQAGGFREVQQGLTDVSRCGSRSSRTTTLPFCGGVTISVETLRQGLEAAGHEAWVFGPRLAGAQDPAARIVRYPSIPATTYPEFAPGRSVLAANRPAGRRAELRRRPRAPPVPPRSCRATPGPPGGAAARLHLPHALREVRALRPAAARPGGVGRAAAERGLRRPRRCGAGALDGGPRRSSTRGASGRRSRSCPRESTSPGSGRATGRPRPATARRRRGRRAGALRRAPRSGEERRSRPRRLRAHRVHRARGASGAGRARHGSRASAATGGQPVGRPADRVFLGVRPHDELAECYQAADVFLFASETETQGLVLAEAAACGSRRSPSMRPACDEVVRDGDTGILTKSDPAALAEAAIGSCSIPSAGAAWRDAPARSPSASSTCACKSTGRWPCISTRSRACDDPPAGDPSADQRRDRPGKAVALGRAGERLERPSPAPRRSATGSTPRPIRRRKRGSSANTRPRGSARTTRAWPS